MHVAWEILSPMSLLNHSYGVKALRLAPAGRGAAE